jgi:hypothetical protein
MYKITNQTAVTVDITADAREDIQDIPTTYGMGSTVFVIEDSSAWMLSGGDTPEWKELE